MPCKEAALTVLVTPVSDKPNAYLYPELQWHLAYCIWQALHYQTEIEATHCIVAQVQFQ